MTRYNMSPRHAEICTTAMGALVAMTEVAGQRMLIHGEDAEGNVDIAFPHVWAAVDWATQYGVRSIVELRDAKKLNDTAVLTFNLYDFAKRRASPGLPITAGDGPGRLSTG